MSRATARLELAAQFCALTATAWLVGANILGPDWRGGHLVPRLTSAALSTGSVILASVFIAVAVRRAAYGTSMSEGAPLTTAIWYSPALLLLMQPSFTSAVPALILIGNATLLLAPPSTFRLAEPPEPSLLAADRSPAVTPVAPIFLLLGALAHIFVIAQLTRQATLAATLAGLSAALLTAAAASRAAFQQRPRNLPTSILGLLLTLLLGLMLSPLSNRGGSDSATNFSFFRRPGTAPATPAPSPPANKPAENGTLPEAPVGGEGFIGGDYTGIILRPELKPVTLLVPPLMSTHNGGVTQVSKPLSIPFGGEYWMYRWPFARPPRNAVVKRGAPANLSFKTTDHVPLLMEARHRLEQPLSIRCCRAIQVEITNADTLANTVYLEVILINNTHPSTQPTLLGSQPVNSVPEKNQPAAELLRFPFPNSPTITQFDEIRILFHRAISRADRSARASINRFVLIP